MYADDTVFFIHDMGIVTSWLNQNCLQMNETKKVCMFFSRDWHHNSDVEQDIFTQGGDYK